MVGTRVVVAVVGGLIAIARTATTTTTADFMTTRAATITTAIRPLKSVNVVVMMAIAMRDTVGNAHVTASGLRVGEGEGGLRGVVERDALLDTSTTVIVGMAAVVGAA